MESAKIRSSFKEKILRNLWRINAGDARLYNRKQQENRETHDKIKRVYPESVLAKVT